MTLHKVINQLGRGMTLGLIYQAYEKRIACSEIWFHNFPNLKWDTKCNDCGKTVKEIVGIKLDNGGNKMVGVKGKSGRHKRDCLCERCSSRRIANDEKPKEGLPLSSSEL